MAVPHRLQRLHRRSAGRHRHVRLEAVDAKAAPVADEDPSAGALEAALDLLPADQRAAVLLVDADGFDYAEAAAILGVPVGTIASRLSRARASLRHHLGGSA